MISQMQGPGGGPGMTPEATRFITDLAGQNNYAFKTAAAIYTVVTVGARGGAFEHPSDAWPFLDLMKSQLMKYNVTGDNLEILSRYWCDEDIWTIGFAALEAESILEMAGRGLKPEDVND
jgi:hypothetical protein